MAEINDRKLYLGPRLRRLRRDLGISQTRMAEELGVSPSYLNHLERNQRPLTAQMLLRMANTYDIDMRDFVAAARDGAAAGLHEILADPLLRDLGLARSEASEVAENHPGFAEALDRLYRALSDLRRMPDVLAQMDGLAPSAGSEVDWLRDYLQQRHNHFAELDAAAEAIGTDVAGDAEQRHHGLRARLEEHRIAVQIVPDDVLAGSVRHYDLHRRRLMIAERLPMASRSFAIAYQLALVALEEPLEAAIGQAAPPTDQVRALLRTALANYAAAAILMPYQRFHEAAEASRYDMNLLQTRFGVSWEQLAHRLTSLGRQGARGIPFFMLKLDPAGNISKRFAGDAFPFARFGGACPRWNLHRAFRLPEEWISQLVEMPDGQRFFTLSSAFARVGAAGAESPVAVALGCDARHAARIVHADGQSAAAAITIGPTCHLCERVACPDRALPPVTRTLEMNAQRRAATPYPFRQT
ncbi:MAG: short-chain fatty acyl-CoA regulator family protein [Pseudomonadota bacterium]|nr:short-chain fatty acyl-CoA regulator family protein [Pseudomonadota bacterium]